MSDKDENIETEHKPQTNYELCKNQFEKSDRLLAIQKEMCDKLECLKFDSPIKYVYNPLKYAKILHETFVRKYFERSTKKIMFLGINPGPWGMCQTGIAFGEKEYVKDWFQITGLVDKPEKEHPKKRVKGLDCHRSEVSGKRLWGFFQKMCTSPENFFKHSFIYNLCPLAFVAESGKNITPPEIKDINIKKQLNDICEEAFINIVNEFKFDIIIGIGKFAEKSAIKALKNSEICNVQVYSIPHPSPRNARSLENWESTILTTLEENNLLKYFKNDK